ncbi:MAG: hypothetical protein J6Q78_00435 [Clostridia bacterium]|nr:hypothetical protein [Clostridia bacterium]
MKKFTKRVFCTFMFLAIVFGVLTTAVLSLSALDINNREEGLMVATLNNVELDGVLDFKPSTSHTYVTDGSGTSTGYISKPGTPHESEYTMDIELINAYVGVAYDLDEKEIYIAFLGKQALSKAEIEIGGAYYSVDIPNETVESRSGGGRAISSSDGYICEIALPMLDMKFEALERGVGTDIEIELVGDDTFFFDGKLLLSEYSSGFSYNATSRPANPVKSSGVIENTDGSFEISNYGGYTNTREYATFSGITTVKEDMLIKMDINVKNLPFSNVGDAANDGPSAWTSIKTPRIWLAFKHRFEESLFCNIQNTANFGLVLNVHFNYYDQYLNNIKSYTTIILDREVNEEFTLELQWNEDESLYVYVDGEYKGEVINALNVDNTLGKVSGVLFFNTQWGEMTYSNESILVDYGNVSVREVSSDFDTTEYLNLLANVPVIDENDGENEGEESISENKEEPKKKEKRFEYEEAAPAGCLASVSGVSSAIAVISALLAVTVKRKKED